MSFPYEILHNLPRGLEIIDDYLVGTPQDLRGPGDFVGRSGFCVSLLHSHLKSKFAIIILSLGIEEQ